MSNIAAFVTNRFYVFSVTSLSLLLCGCWPQRSMDFVWYAGKGDYKNVKAFIDQGIDVNTYGYDGNTALYVASKNGYVDIVKLLIDSKVDVNKTIACGVTPLHIAASYGNTEVIQLLLKAGANPNAKTDLNRTPLYEATLGKHPDVVEILKKAGAKE